MKTDNLSYRFLQEWPDCFFRLVGRPAADAARFRFEAIELKGTAVRIDGVYSPLEPDEAESVYFVEFQNHPSERTYSNLLLKIGLFLEKVNPRQNWQAVVIYPNRSIEQENLHPYRGLLQCEQMKRIYLDELPEPGPSEIGLAILRLIVATPETAAVKAKKLVPQVQKLNEPAQRQWKMIELIATIVMYQLPELTRKEVEHMLQLNDIRKSKVYQEALEEGREEGREGALETIALRMLERKEPVKKISELTGLSRAVLKRLQKSKKG